VDSKTVIYPGNPRPRIEPLSSIDDEGVNLTRITLGSHTGTHVDAQSHFLHKGRTVENEPLDKFIWEALVVDASDKQGLGLDARDLQVHRFNRNDIVLLYTGTGNRASRFTYLELSGAQWLVDHGIKCVGIDTLSLEKFGRKDAPVHKLLLSKDVGIIENLTNLREFVNKRLFFVCLPIPIAGVDGSPARAIFLEIIK
jgi:kynurenine formamidase